MEKKSPVRHMTMPLSEKLTYVRIVSPRLRICLSKYVKKKALLSEGNSAFSLMCARFALFFVTFFLRYGTLMIVCVLCKNPFETVGGQKGREE